MASIALNLFTNCMASAPSIRLLERTYNSFTDTFGYVPCTIYVDPTPNRVVYDEYVQNLYDKFGGQIIETSGLADGYLRSIENSAADYVFQLEHDWIFQMIDHSLEEIVGLMELKDINYLRFNKFPNEDFDWLRKWQSFLIPQEVHGMKYCLTDNISNNPHIINRQYYADNLIDKIDAQAAGSNGVEQNLEKRGFVGAVYGGLNHPATIIHLDGKNNDHA